MSDRDHLIDMITGAWKTRVIGEATALGLFDQIGEGSAEIEPLSAAVGANADGLMRLLRALATLGLVKHDGPAHFSLTPLGNQLRRDVPGSLYGMSGHWGGRMWNSFTELGKSVLSGEAAVPSGRDHFAEQQADPAKADVFNRAMAEGSLLVGRSLAVAYDFSDVQVLRDVGGGYGALLVGPLENNAQLRGEIFDLPTLSKAALGWQEGQGVRDQLSYVGGSFFDHVPRGADCILLKFILHDWDDANSRIILQNCRDAIGDGRILIIERIVPETVGPDDQDVIRGDLIMLTVGGKERTEAEYHALLAGAGLRITNIIALDGGYSAIEARPS